MTIEQQVRCPDPAENQAGAPACDLLPSGSSEIVLHAGMVGAVEDLHPAAPVFVQSDGGLDASVNADIARAHAAPKDLLICYQIDEGLTGGLEVALTVIQTDIVDVVKAREIALASLRGGARRAHPDRTVTFGRDGDAASEGLLRITVPKYQNDDHDERGRQQRQKNDHGVDNPDTHLDIAEQPRGVCRPRGDGAALQDEVPQRH